LFQEEELKNLKGGLPNGELARHHQDPNRVEVIEDDHGIVTGRYAHEAGERIPRPRTEEERGRSEMGYMEYLKWQLSKITTGSRNKCDKKDAKIIEQHKSITRKQEEPRSNSSSSNRQPVEEFYSPERKRTLNSEGEEESKEVVDEDDEDKWPVFEDYHLRELIDMRIKQIRSE
jgi:hypothetical protein